MPENFQGTEEHFPLWTAIITSMATQELMADKPLASFNLNCFDFCLLALLSRTRTNTNPNGTEANAAGRSVRACVARKSKS